MTAAAERDCPRPDKTRLHDPAHARRLAAFIVRDNNARRKVVPPLWWYRCVCGWLHLTSRPPREEPNGRTGGVAHCTPATLQEWAFPAAPGLAAGYAA